MVEVEKLGQIKEMADLKLGDNLLTRAGRYDVVYSFSHYAPKASTSYLQISFEWNMGPLLEITADHTVFQKNGMALPAGAIMVGNSLIAASKESDDVVKDIQAVERQGAYASFAGSGSTGVVASNYVSLDTESIFRTHWMDHLFQDPPRLICLSSPAFCMDETRDEHGLSWWIAGPLDAPRNFLPPAWMAQMEPFLFVLPLKVIFTILEFLAAQVTLGLVLLVCLQTGKWSKWKTV
jgi:hypothetical protein